MNQFEINKNMKQKKRKKKGYYNHKTEIQSMMIDEQGAGR